MTRNGKLLAGAAAILTLGSAAAVASRHSGWHHNGHHGWGGSQGIMGLAGPLCRENPAERADLMMVRLQYKVNPTDAQKPAFDELKSAVKTAAAKVAAACPAKAEPAQGTDRMSTPKDITARLAETEAQLAAALDGVKTIRPAAERLYASLDEAQKKAVSEIGLGRHGKWHHRGHHRWMDRDANRTESESGPDTQRGPDIDDAQPGRAGGQ